MCWSMKTMMMLNQAVRYSHIIQILRRYGCIDPSVRILEVGSGSIGLGDYVKSRFIGCDIELRNISPYLLPVIGSSHQLPFKDSSFDVTTSSDMLEHLANENRLEAICELLRVSRRIVVIATPCGRESELCERKIASLYSRAHKKQPEWLTEHLVNGPPDEELISSILSAKKKYCISILLITRTSECTT